MRTPDGVCILLCNDTPFNGLCFEDGRTKWIVWYGTSNAQNGWVSRDYYGNEISKEVSQEYIR